MMYICAIFCSPLYFMIRGNGGAAFLNLFFWGFAWLLLISIFGAFLSPFPWLIGVIHAMWYLRHELMVENAELIATKMAEKFRQPEAQSSAQPAYLVPCPACGTANEPAAVFCMRCGVARSAPAPSTF